MANVDVNLYVQPSELITAHGVARLLSELEQIGCCQDATSRLQRRGYWYGFRDVAPYWKFSFPATGTEFAWLPRTPVLSIVEVLADADAQDLGGFWIEDGPAGRIGSDGGFWGSEEDLSQSSPTARAARQSGYSSNRGSSATHWTVTYTGGAALPDLVRATALALAKVRADEIRAVAAGGEFATSDRFTQSRARLLSQFPVKVNRVGS